MLTVDELWARLDCFVTAPLPVESVDLSTALGRVLREPVVADVDQPAFDRSAFDGYLARLDQPLGLVKIKGAIEPGTPAPAHGPLLGEVFRIFTGSAVPTDAVGIVMQEDTTPGESGGLQLNATPDASFIRRRGSQCQRGQVLLAEAQRLGPGQLALLATVGQVRPKVSRQVRVAYLATGAELISPEMTPAAGQIRDSNSVLIAALVAAHGGRLVWQHRVTDDRTQTRQALGEALDQSPDILLIGGGASVGAHDHTAWLLREWGFAVHAEKVASRPGKPFIAASRGAVLACGLPGNPLSHLVCFHLFVRRLMDRLHGLEPADLKSAHLADGAAWKPDRRETWWPARLESSLVTPLPWRDSSDVTALAKANVLLRIPANSALGSKVAVLPLTSS